MLSKKTDMWCVCKLLLLLLLLLLFVVSCTAAVSVRHDHHHHHLTPVRVLPALECRSFGIVFYEIMTAGAVPYVKWRNAQVKQEVRARVRPSCRMRLFVLVWVRACVHTAVFTGYPTTTTTTPLRCR